MVDTGKVSAPMETVATAGGDGGVPIGATFQGEAGAAPAGALVRVTNLDSENATVVTGASDDGSFSITIPVVDGDELRFEAVVGERRSEPSDALISGNRLEPSPRHACVALEPGFALELTGQSAGIVSVVSSCDSEVTLANPSARLGLPDFELDTELPAVAAAGERVDLTILHPSAGEGEDVIFVDVTLSGETLRYPVTLYAE